MIIDKKGKLFGKINILDIFIVILFICILFVAVKFLSPSLIGGDGAKTPEVVYTIEVTNQPLSFFESIEKGDMVYGENTTEQMGTIEAVNTMPSVINVEDKESMKIVKNTIPDKYDGLVKVRSKAEISNPDITVSGKDIKVGELAARRTENTILRGYIVAIEPIDDAFLK